MTYPFTNQRHRIIIDQEQISSRINELVKIIANDFDDKDFVIIGILKGSFIFLADLVRLIYGHNLNPQIDFVILSSYGASTSSSGKVKIERDVSIDITGKNVLIVDDILDSGRTMKYISERLRWLEPAMTKTCVLLDKPSRRVTDIEPDYVGFKVKDEFVIGYGLDFDGYFRELPYIAVLDENSLD